MEGEVAFHSWAVGIRIFVEMNFGDAVVVEADGLANGILCDFESAIQISSERRLEIEANRETEGLGSQAFKKISPVRGLVEDGREMFPYCDFVVAAYGG